MTTPDQIRRFLKKRPLGAGRLTVSVETPLGVGHAVAEFSQEQLTAALEPDSTTGDPVLAIMEACQEYANSDGNDQHFVLRWFGGHDRVIATLKHKARPERDDDSSGAGSGFEPTNPLAAMLIQNRELMGHLSTLQSRQNAALPQICQSYERAIALLAQQLQASMQRESDLREQLRVVQAGATPQQRELTGEEREEALRRGEAWHALADILKGRLGEALDLAIAAGAQKLLPAAGEGLKQ